MQKRTILFVEDNDVLRENYRFLLESYFDIVYEAKNGEEGYQLYKNHKPDVLLLDINLPLLNGIDLLARIRETDPITKAVIMTGNTSTDFLVRAAELKLTKFLVKPIKRNDLINVIELIYEELNRYQIISKEIIRLKDNYTWDCAENFLFDADMKQVKLTKQEIILMQSFINISGVLYYEQLCKSLWDDFVDINPLKTAIKKLRKKLPPNSIENVYGIGYRFLK